MKKKQYLSRSVAAFLCAVVLLSCTGVLTATIKTASAEVVGEEELLEVPNEQDMETDEQNIQESSPEATGGSENSSDASDELGDAEGAKSDPEASKDIRDDSETTNDIGDEENSVEKDSTPEDDDMTENVIGGGNSQPITPDVQGSEENPNRENAAEQLPDALEGMLEYDSEENLGDTREQDLADEEFQTTEDQEGDDNIMALYDDDGAQTISRYRNQAYWWWNIRQSATVWWSGFQYSGDGIEPLPDGDSPHIRSVSLTTLYGQYANTLTEGETFELFQGDGTDSGTNAILNSMDAETRAKIPLLSHVFPLAGPGLTGGDIAADLANGEAFEREIDGNGAYELYEIEEGGDISQATHISAMQLDMSALPNVSYVDTGKVVINSETANTILMQKDIEWPGVGYFAKDVKYWVKGGLSNEVGINHQRVRLNIVPDFGYYVTNVVVTCANNGGSFTQTSGFNRGNAYHLCGTFNAGDAFRSDFDISDNGTVSVVLDSEDFSHYGSVSNKYFVMIHTNPTPQNIYIQYYVGEADGLDMSSVVGSTNWVTETEVKAGSKYVSRSVSDNVPVDEVYAGTEDEREESRLLYTVASPTAEALAAANKAGYKFAGWKFQYYGCDGNLPDWNSELGDESDVEPEDSRMLWSHARLVAQWEPIGDDADESVRTMPSTGGSGTETTLFTVCGVFLIAVSLGTIGRNRRKLPGGSLPSTGGRKHL